MKQYPLFDLHCDTLYESLKQDVSLRKNDLRLSFETLAEYPKYCQILAMWSDHKLDGDAAYTRFFEARDKLSAELEGHTSPRLCTSDADLAACERDGVGAVFLAVEGGKLLCEDITRLDTLYESGVRFLTLVWKAICPIGGAFNTEEGLTDFGYDVLRRCKTLGIIPDLSHASAKMTDETIAFAEENSCVCIATHSNSRAVCDHPRNLTDERFARIARLGGIVGISMAPQHLTLADECRIDDIVRHIEHYLSLGGENTVCLGADLDGTDLPSGFLGIEDMESIRDAMLARGYGDALIEKITFGNALRFVRQNLKA